jgi:hypothetical protein
MSSSAMLGATNSRNNGRRDASNTAPVLGQSLSNFTGRKRAIALFDGMSHIMNYIKFEQLTLAVVAGGGMECIVRKFLTGCANHPIPFNFNGVLMPEDPNDRKRLMYSGIFQNIKLVVCQLRERFPGHPAFPTNLQDKLPEWTTVLYDDTQKTWKRNYDNIWSKDSSILFGKNEGKALYQHNHPRADDDEKLGKSAWHHRGLRVNNSFCVDAEQVVDLEYMGNCLVIASNAQNLKPLSDLNKIGLVRHACGRGGEAGDPSYGEISWEERHQVWTCPWSSTKTVTRRLLPFVQSKNELTGDINLNMAFLIGPGRGLLRTPAQERAGTASSVHPDLRTIRPDSIAGKLSTTMKTCLPGSIPEHVKAGISSRSLRQGSCTEMGVSPNVSDHDLCARSGHSIGNNSQSYLDADNFCRALPGAHCLAGNDDCITETVTLPDICNLGVGCMPAFMRLYDDVFLEGCGVPEFAKQEGDQKQGRCYILGQKWLSVYLMRYNELRAKYGSNSYVVTWLEDAAGRAELRDPRKPHLVCPVSVLASWSRDLLEAFETTNECSFAPNAKNLMRMLERQGKLVTDLTKEVKTLRHRIDDFESDVKGDLKAQSAGVVKVVETNNSLMQEDHARLKQQAVAMFNEVAYLRQKCAVLASPKGKRKAGATFDLCSPEEEPSSAAASAPSKPRGLKFGKAEEEAPCGKPCQITNVHCEASEVVNVGNTNVTVTHPNVHLPPPTTLRSKALLCQKAKTSLTQWQIDCHSMKFFRRGNAYHLNKRPVPNSCLEDKWAHWNVAQLCWFVTTSVERDVLAEKFPDKLTKASMKFYHDLSGKMMDQMWLFEGEDPVAKRALQGKSRGAGCTASVQALGGRLRTYKQLISFIDNAKGVELMERSKYLKKFEERRGPSTPPDCRNIGQFFRLPTCDSSSVPIVQPIIEPEDYEENGNDGSGYL